MEIQFSAYPDCFRAQSVLTGVTSHLHLSSLLSPMILLLAFNTRTFDTSCPTSCQQTPSPVLILHLMALSLIGAESAGT